MGAQIESGLERYFRDRPVRVIWAMRDIAFTPEMLDRAWLHTFPKAEVTRLEDAGHYLQVPELLRFLAALPDRPAGSKVSTYRTV